ncbi:uncharacterized protein LOC126894337 isoform X2 [Daktulosphaira vitifoliae]|uniref:uncharacterized protein LOC126894337 isoform X2 n=1 Tax=Daktulosphaira vitifoliae TaxID=58002 RepID=UPI0021AA5B4B|nr:uncharacterized protein LOC126894337 isoform X2 [Daktulosphaira vitifoliae]
MNKKGATISVHLNEFNENLYKLVLIFNKELISPEPYECILEVYKKHENKCDNVDEDYRNDLLSCKNLIKDKVHFLMEPDKKSMDNIPERKLLKIHGYYNKIFRNFMILPSSNFPSFKDITGYKNQSLCTICKRNSGIITDVHIFLPCRCGWCCEGYNHSRTECPVCHQEITGTQSLNIVTPAKIIVKGV